MQRSQLSEQVVKDIVRHLFDPQSPSRSATRALISTTLILEFPLLPPAHEASAAVTTSTSREAVFKRHSPSAQALSLFRLPGFVVNHLPGSQWNLEFDYVRDVSAQVAGDGDDFQLSPGAVRWRASIAWSLVLRSPFHLPLGLGEKLVLHRQDSREVELVFAFSESDADQKLRLARETKLVNEPSGSRPSASFEDESDVQLVRVRYTGLHFPLYFKRLPLYETITKYIPYVFALLLGPLYGVLLLLGLDHSTPSLDASRRRRLRLEKKRARLAENERVGTSDSKSKGKEREVDLQKGKGKERPVEDRKDPPSPHFISTNPTRTTLTSDSDDGSDFTGGASHDGDGELESRYHRLMRQGHSSIETIRDYQQRTTEILAKTFEEIGLVQWFIRSAVVVAAEGGLSVAGVGAEMLNEAGLDFGEDPEQSKRMRQMEQARRGIHRRSKTISKAEPTPIIDKLPSNSTWTNRSSPAKKRVSFSLSMPTESARFNAPRSPLGPGDLSTPDSAFSKFRAELDKSSAAVDKAGVDEEGEGQAEEHRYPQEVGHPQQVPKSPLAPGSSPTVHDAAMISTPSVARVLATSALDSTSIAEGPREEENTSSLGVLFGPRGSNEHVKSAEEAIERDEMGEVDQLLGVLSTEDPGVSTSTSTSKFAGRIGDEQVTISSSPTSSGLEAISASAAEDFLDSPASTETPFLSPETPPSQSLARDPTAPKRQDSATSIPYPRTPSDSPEMARTRSLYGDGGKSAETEVAQPVLPVEGVASSSGTAASERSASMGGSSAAGDEGQDAGVKEKKTKKNKGKGGKKGSKKSEIGCA